ncbi:DUF2339 domain-containing protein [Pseudoxanthomonas winnipegensis]|uniref:DUF2339 domain-containing protein n=1 Tax=Pseudoxanthomonas winnipegensis TaxID=2480810 RepID=UPI00257838CF|nr:DUF2339 domain-containing protein [Pseudoxanthomonas winnipegensis]WJI15910.1 DUF2339 domain-containing protein [Pseudoxanthomonas winnipegensis]
MEAGIALVVLVLLAVPVALVVALAQIAGLKRRLRMLEERLDARTPSTSTDSRAASASAWRPEDEPAQSALDALTERDDPGSPSSVASEDVAARPVAASSAQEGPPPLPPPEPVQAGDVHGPSVLERALAAAKRWITEGNVPVKVGMLVLLAGVAALLKYAGDQGWLTLPVELRYAGIAAAALGGLVFGWRQRFARRGFALALQGGAIGVLLLVVFAAFKLSALMAAPLALGLSVALVASMCVLAVAQDSRTLAMLALLAGFMAPVWLSDGSGNHVALFAYYAMFNAAVFAIAWFRAWRVLNLLGFAFTFGIGTVWGVLSYRPALFASAEPFLLLFFAFYLLIPVLHARRGDVRAPMVDGSLLFGTPLVAFALQAGLLDGARMPLALNALVLAAIYAALAAWLLRGDRTRLLGQGHAALAVGFATLAIPLALSARATASVFALEGAGLLWLGLRQQRRLPQLAGVALQAMAAAGYALGTDGMTLDEKAVANPGFMSALLLALAGLASAWTLRAHERRREALLAYLWGLGWWCVAGVVDIVRFVPGQAVPDALLAWTALSGAAAAEAHRRRPAAPLAWTMIAALAVAFPLVAWQIAAHDQPFAGSGGPAWVVFAALALRGLWNLRRAGGGRASMLAQCLWVLLWPTVLALGGAWVAERFDLADGWRWALAGWPWLLATALALWRWSWLAWPQNADVAGLRGPLMRVLFAILALGWLGVLMSPASPAPLPWLPLLNPGELAQLAMLVLLGRWLAQDWSPAMLRRQRLFVLAGGALLLLTGSVLHGVHHWGGIAWDARLLSSSLAQTSLTVAWSLLGVIGWVLGSRRGQRPLWIAGAALMALVLAKLVLVDRQHLGNLLGIGSFIAYGLLCTAVGYLAPAPPRRRDA